MTRDHLFQESRPLLDGRSDIFVARGVTVFATDRLAHDNFIFPIARSRDEKRKDFATRDPSKNERSGRERNVAAEKPGGRSSETINYEIALNRNNLALTQRVQEVEGKQ